MECFEMNNKYDERPIELYLLGYSYEHMGEYLIECLQQKRYSRTKE